MGDRDLVEGSIELAVAAAVEALALDATAAGFERGDAGVAGELGVACEACDRTDLAEQLCGSHWSAAPLPGPALTGSWVGAPGSPGGA